MLYYNPYYPNNGAMPDMLNQLRGQQMPMQQPMAQTMPYMTPTQMNASPVSERIWVLGETEAASYPVARNSSVDLWDRNQQTFYYKYADAQGIPTMETYDYKKRQLNPPAPSNNVINEPDGKFVDIEQFNALKVKFDELSAKFEETINSQHTNSKKSKGDITNE